MPAEYEIIAIQTKGKRSIDEFANIERVCATGCVLELQRMNPHLLYDPVSGQIDAERLHDEPRYHPLGRYRNR